jgi:hypothetical protein
MIRMEVNAIPIYFSKIRERTMRVVACIRPDKVEWRAADKFTLENRIRERLALRRVSSVVSSGGSSFVLGEGIHAGPLAK